MIGNRLNFLLIILLFGCNTSKRFEAREKASECQNDWIYYDCVHDSSFSIKTLLFKPYKVHHITAFSSLVIGVNEAGDTVGFVDKDFKYNIEIGTKVIIEKSDWDLDQKKRLRPVSIWINDKKINKILCSVHIIGYANFKNP